MLRSLGWEERYLAGLPKALHDVIPQLVAGTWVPIDLGLAHYRACDAMTLTANEIREMGEQVSLRTQRTFIGTLGKVVAGAGATPWTLCLNAHRIWGRIFDGGDHAVYGAGPKEALVLIVGCPLFEVAYFRLALRHYYRALFGLLARTVYAREEPKYAPKEGLALRFSWV